MAALACSPLSASTERQLGDGELWRELVQGNITALEELYDRYGGLASGLAARLLDDHQSAEEVVQESFLQVWRNADRYNPRRGTLRCWLLAIVHHRCIDVLRRRAARPRFVTWDAEIHTHPSASDTWTDVENRLTQIAVQRALRQLSAEQREVIKLGYFEGYTHMQIAERLGLPLGTVKGRLRLGLKHLRDLLT